MRLILLAILLVALQGCTVGYYTTKDNLNAPRENIHNDSCVINYSLAVSAEIRKGGGYTRERPEWADEAKPEYIARAEKVFKEQGCSANYKENEGKANFLITVKISPYHNSLPQEWLTGLSGGAIPSSGTREKEYIFTFANKAESTQHTYSIDEITYNHIILAPVSLPSFFWFHDDVDAFEKALKNFMENT